MTIESRRKFCKKVLVVLSAAPFVLEGVKGDRAFAQDLPKKPLDPASPTAAALGYVHDATKVDTVKFPKRKAPEGNTQFCDNCQFYTVRGLKAEGQEGEWGKCALFQDGLVAAKGWCNSWMLKQA